MRLPIVLPQVIVDAEPQAVGAGWCKARGLGLGDVSPLHVATYIRTHPRSAPTVKQHLAAIRMLGGWLVVSQIFPSNPAAAVRGPKHVVTKGAPPVLSPAEARKLLGSIDTGALAGHRAPTLGHALQLRAGERGAGDASAGLLRAGEPGLVVRLQEKGLPDEGVDLAQRSAHARGQRVYTAAGRRATVVAYGDPPQRRKLEVRRFARDFKRAMHSGPHVARDMLARQASTAKGCAVTVSAGVDSLTVASVLGGRSVERLLVTHPGKGAFDEPVRVGGGPEPREARDPGARHCRVPFTFDSSRVAHQPPSVRSVEVAWLRRCRCGCGHRPVGVSWYALERDLVFVDLFGERRRAGRPARPCRGEVRSIAAEGCLPGRSTAYVPVGRVSLP